QLRAYRCTAAIAGPSGGGQDHPVDALRLQVRGDLAAHLPRLDHRGADAGRDDVAPVERAERMPFLELAQRVERGDVVGVRVRRAPVVARVDRFVLPRIEAVDA